jgi:hypothetical protein
MPTTVTQLRRAQVTNLLEQYSIEASVIDRGDLPDPGAFLLEIIDEADPKDDTLARVATVADLETYGLNRATAVLTDVGFYRSSTVTKYYDDVRTAVAAKDFLKEKVNDLATEYDTFLNLFKADGTGGYPVDTEDYPQTSIGLLTPAITAYTDKVAERTAQQAIVADKTVECAELTVTYDNAVITAAAAQTTLDSLQNAENAMTAMSASVTAFRGDTDDLSVDVAKALSVWNVVRLTPFAPTAITDPMDDEMEDPASGGAAGRLWTEWIRPAPRLTPRSPTWPGPFRRRPPRATQQTHQWPAPSQLKKRAPENRLKLSKSSTFSSARRRTSSIP